MKIERKHALVPVLLGLALVGCVTAPLPPNQKVFLYVTEGHVMYNGENFSNMEMNKIPERLRRAGVRPENEIVLIPQGNVQDIYLKSIAGVCGHGSYPNVVIREKPKATAVTQRRGIGIAPQHGTKPPKFVSPNAKKKAADKARQAPNDGWAQGFPGPDDRHVVKPPKR